MHGRRGIPMRDGGWVGIFAHLRDGDGCIVVHEENAPGGRIARGVDCECSQVDIDRIGTSKFQGDPRGFVNCTGNGG